MNALSLIGTVVAAIMAIMTTVVSWHALRNHSTLGNPVLPLCIGLLSFVGLRYLPEGLANTVLIGYVALAIAILFLLLFMAFQKARRLQHFDDLAKPGATQTRRTQSPRADLASRSSDVQLPRGRRRQPSDEDSIP